MPQAKAHEQAKERGEIFVGVCPAVNKKRAQFSDLLVAQVKTMSFMAYVLRVATPTLQPYKHVVAEVTVRLMKDCPPEASPNRKVSSLGTTSYHCLSDLIFFLGAARCNEACSWDRLSAGVCVARGHSLG
jgi:hypothetical protein